MYAQHVYLAHRLKETLGECGITKVITNVYRPGDTTITGQMQKDSY
ncbi:MAG: hypothetical protein RSD36_00040 [Terrisporobacter sp.]